MKIYFKNCNLNVEVNKSLTLFNILLNHYKEGLKKALFAIINDYEIIDLHSLVKLQKNSIEIEIVKDINDTRFFTILNHSCAHLMAAAVNNLYKNSKFWVGPAIKEGFYYDIDANLAIENSELEKIAQEMNKLIKENIKITKEEISLAKAKEIFKNDPYKMDLIKNIKDDLSIYKFGSFIDLCKGPHVFDVKLLKHFKLLSVSGSYFQGDKTKNVLSRIYGTCWPTEEKLNHHLQILENRKMYDHRKIGKELKLFMIDPLIGQGLVVWLPMGMQILERVSQYIKEIERKYGFLHIATPVLGSLKLYKISGHWKHYHENMYPIMKIDDEKLILRPMSCPHHCMVFKHELHSYRDLPVRYAEEVIQYRYEASGSLSGLERVRGMRLTDAHIFVDLKKLNAEIKLMLKMIEEVLTKFQIKIAYYRLSLHDPNDKINFISNIDVWNKSENILRDILKQSKYKFVEAVGEAAFYGPKIDIQIETILGHEVTISTLQLDFLAAKKFNLFFINEQNKKEAPILLHRGLIGTYERFLSILIEQTAGVFPFWYASIQVAIISVCKNNNKYATKIAKYLQNKDIYTKVYIAEDRLSYKIRDAVIKKIPYQIIVGDQEEKNKNIQLREYQSKKNTQMTLATFLKMVKNK